MFYIGVITLVILCGGCSGHESFHAGELLVKVVEILEYLVKEKQETDSKSPTSLQTQIDQMNSTLETLEEQMRLKQSCDCSTKPQHIAFRAQLGKDIGKVSSNQVIIFDEVALNLGNAYGSKDGIFTAPVNGTYLFSMALGNPTGNAGAFFMKKNSQTIEYAIAGHTTGWNMGGVTTVAELAAGDNIWVEGEGYISGAYSTKRYHTGFSGVLIHAY